MNTGDIALVNYGERPVTWHTRILMSHVCQDFWIILTPNMDYYEEQMSLSNTDYVDFRFLGAGAPIPPDINPMTVYGFGAVDPLTMARLRAQADAMAVGARALHPAPPPLPGPVVAPPPLPAPPPGVPGVAMAWGP